MLPDENPAARWLTKVHHDLVKRMLWVARDCRALDRSPIPGELVASLMDEEGLPIGGLALWQRLAEEAPDGWVLEEFTTAVTACLAAAESNDLAGVLALEAAFEKLRNRQS